MAFKIKRRALLFDMLGVLKSLQPAKKYFVTMFLVSCLLLAVFTLVIYKQSKSNEDSNYRVVHSYEILRDSNNILISMYEANTAQRDYFNSGSVNDLASYNADIEKIKSDLDAIAGLTIGNPAQQANLLVLRSAFDQFRTVGAAEISTFRRQGKSTFALPAHMRVRQRIMDTARAKVRLFSQAETDLLQIRRQEARVQRRNYILTLFIGAILDLGALVVANLVIFSLIAKNTRAEDKLRKSEKLFATILNGINDGVYDYNVPKGTITYSDSYPRIWGYTGEELGREHDNFYNFVHPDDVEGVKEKMRQYLAREIPSYCNIFRVRHRDGRWVWVMSRGVGLWDDQGRIQRLIGTHTDITEQKQHEEELKYFAAENERQRQELVDAKEKADIANQAKSDFLATMSHEIRTPLNVIIGLTRLLMNKVQTPQKREMVETLYANADILSKLVNDLLDLTRVESAQIELEKRPFALGALFNAVRAMFEEQARGKGLSLSITDNSKGQVFIGDPTRLQQILVNLLSNALKFTSRGGIAITADCTAQSSNIADLKITVADTGIGIPPEKLSTIFERFVQADQTISRRFGGSGLGLAISKSLAQLMSGDITVASKPGEGSVFTVSLALPVGRRQDIAPAIRYPTVKTSITRGTVLVVEDYAANVMVASMMLEHLGYAVDVAASGGDAIEKIRGQREPYVAILMDVQMQDMDGFETTRRIRELEKEKGFHHFIIGVTAHALAGDRERCIEAGMDDYMSKPVHPDLLAKKLGTQAKAA